MEVLTVALGFVIIMECDGYKSYLNLKDVEPLVKKYATGNLRWLYTVLSNLKNILRGTYHGRCTEIQPYIFLRKTIRSIRIESYITSLI